MGERLQRLRRDTYAGRIVAGGVAAGAAIALVASLPGSSKHAECKTINGTTGVRVIGASKEGGQNAVNSGECVGVYNPETLRSVGNLAHNAAFVLECIDGPKPAAFRIEGPNGLRGDIDLDSHLVHQLNNTSEFAGLQNCQ